MFTEQEAIEEMIKIGRPIYMACAGAPFDVPERLLSVAGVSRIFLGCTIPYNPAAFDDFVDVKIGSGYCSDKSAVRLALASYRKAMKFCFSNKKPTHNCIGIGATSAVATNRARRSRDQLFVAVATIDRLDIYHYVLNKSRSREEQAEFCNKILMCIIMDVVFDYDPHKIISLQPKYWNILDQTEVIASAYTKYGGDVRPFGKLFLSNPSGIKIDIKRTTVPLGGYLFINKDGEVCSWGKYCGEGPHLPIIFPGSFNPLHVGHINMAEAIEKSTGREVVFEISLDTVDKSPISVEEAFRRAEKIYGRWGFLIGGEGTKYLLDKVMVYAVGDFIVGEDTLSRLVDASYYSEEQDINEILTAMRNLGVRFHVFRRKEAKIPVVQLSQMMTVVNEEFDISSTEVRKEI